jgi:hypothetical protein
MILLAVLLHAATPAQAPVQVNLGGFRTVGLSADEETLYRSRLEDELSAIGVRLVQPEDIDPSCYDELDCLQEAVGTARGLLDVELVRVGPFMQAKFRLWDATGDLLFLEDGMEDATDFRDEGSLVPNDFAARVGASGTPLAPVPAPQAAGAEPTKEVARPQAEQPSDPEDEPILGYSGIGLAVVGGALILGGGLLALNEAGVLENAQSLGADKERARVLGPSALVAAGLGVLVLGGGGGLATLGFAGR